MAGRKTVASLAASLAREPFPVEATDDAVEAARSFVMEMWLERHREREDELDRILPGRTRVPPPADLSGSCKFSSLFAAAVFGAAVRGNERHQFCVLGGRVLDLNLGAADVAGDPSAHGHDPFFFGSRDHLDSLRSCLPRVSAWLEEYAARLAREASPSVPR